MTRRRRPKKGTSLTSLIGGSPGSRIKNAKGIKKPEGLWDKKMKPGEYDVLDDVTPGQKRKYKSGNQVSPDQSDRFMEHVWRDVQAKERRRRAGY